MVEYINFLRATILTGGGGTFGQVEIPLPNIMLSASVPSSGFGNKYGGYGKSYAFIIHSISVEVSRALTADGESSAWQLTKESKTALSNMNDPQVLEQDTKVAEGAAYITNLNQRFGYAPPMLISVPKLYFGAQHSAAAATYRIKIGYTIREVDTRDFLAGLAQ